MAKRHKAHDEEHIDETWLIPYADLLTLLLALFIVLFALSQVDQKKFDELSKSLSSAFDGGYSFFESSDLVPIDDISANRDENEEREKNTEPGMTVSQEKLEQIEKETVDLENLKKELDQYILDHQLENQLETNLNHQELRITISDTALFGSGSAALRTDAQNLAVAIANMIEDYPNYEIKIAGHTDDRPISTAEFPSNWDLSAQRALNFMKILLNHDDSDPARYSTIGYGEYRPIDTNDTAEGRAKNRRVEVSILRNFLEDELINVD